MRRMGSNACHVSFRCLQDRRRILEQAGMDTAEHSKRKDETLSNADYPVNRRKEQEPRTSHDPVHVQDVDQFDTTVEAFSDKSLCNPFSVLQDAGWCMCAFGGDFPTMKVEILED